MEKAHTLAQNICVERILIKHFFVCSVCSCMSSIRLTMPDLPLQVMHKRKRFGLRNSLHHFDHLQVSLPRQSVENFERSLEDHYSVITDPWTCRTQFDTKHNTEYHTGWLNLQWDHEPRVTSAVEQSSKAGQTKRWHMSTTADTCWHISALLLVVVKPVQSHAKNATQNHMEPLCSSRSSL